MKQICLNEYKEYLVNSYKHECDNNEIEKNKRFVLLSKKYTDEFLVDIIIGTYSFANKIITISENDYYGFIRIPLESEPDIKFIELDLTGGWMSDTIVKDSDNNFYSLGLLRKIFGDLFIIEPCKVEISEEFDEGDDISILSEIPSYYLYIQCKKEIIDAVRGCYNLSFVRRKDK